MLFAVIVVVVARGAVAARRSLRSYTEEEERWRAEGFPPEVRRVYPQLRVQIIDKPRMQLLGYVEKGRRSVGGGLRPKIEVLWIATSPPAAGDARSAN